MKNKFDKQIKRNGEYWKKRFEILEESAVNRGLEYYESLDRQYREAEKRIESQISVWYQRFENNNNITLADARKFLTSSELEELRWSVEEYIKHGTENAISQEWMRELENASTKVHISRLESLKLQLQQEVEVLYGNQVDGIDRLAREIYTEGYYHTAFEVQRGFNVGWDFQSLDTRRLDKVISKPWTADGRTFKDKAWTQKSELVSILHMEITQAIIRGDALDRAINTIAKKFDVAKSKAGRLVMTESAYFSSVAQKDCFNDLDVEQFKIVATIDSRTSPICQSLDGKVQDMKDFEPGVTAPPFHPWCRSTTAPYFEDEEGYRAARGADGKVYYIPSNMTYKEWAEKFVEDANYGQYGHMTRDAEQYERYKKVLKEISPDSLSKFKEIKYNDSEKWKRLKYQYRTVNRYEVDGDVPIDTILKLDNAAWYTKLNGFDISKYQGKLNSKKRSKYKNFQKEGNTASMLLDEQIYYSHSQIKRKGTPAYEAYTGEYPLIGFKKKRRFFTHKLGDGIRREYDTEAKFLEYVADVKKPEDTFTVTILSEKHICESCQGVVQQFKEMFPNATVNVVSGKKGYNNESKGTKTYEHRKGYKKKDEKQS